AVTRPSPEAPAPVEMAGGGGDDFGMEIERGGAMIPLPHASSGRDGGPSSGTHPSLSARRPSATTDTGLEVSYRRLDARQDAPERAPVTLRVLAWLVPIVLFLGTGAALVKLA